MLDHRYASIEELAGLLRRRKVSATELTRATLDDLELIAPRYNGLAALMPERALREARQAEARLRRGGAPLLTGIPYGAKDLIAARGAPTTWGAPHFREQRFDTDASVVARLLSQRAILTAKLATVELAGAGGTVVPGASLQGQGRNPWDPRRYSGGSSSGPAIAVCLGLLPFAIGTETGGSIVSPASYSGVSAIRPTFGLVPRDGVMALSWTLDKVGVLARSISDCAIVLEKIAGATPRDPSSAGRFQRMDKRAANAAVRRVRLGVSASDSANIAAVARQRVDAGLQVLGRMTTSVKDVSLPADFPYTAMLDLLTLAEGATIFAEHLEAGGFDLVDERQRARLNAGLQIRARDYLQAMRLRSILSEKFRGIFREVDVFAAAGRADTAPRLDGPAVLRSDATDADRLRTAGNLAGLPGVFVPCGLATDGMPVGLQLVGPPRSEPLLVALGEAFQRETDHHLARPTDAVGARATPSGATIGRPA